MTGYDLSPGRLDPMGERRSRRICEIAFSGHTIAERRVYHTMEALVTSPLGERAARAVQCQTLHSQTLLEQSSRLI
jgi:hypothetical protein